MKKIVVLSLLLLTGFIAVIYTKKEFGGDSILWNGTASTPQSDSVGIDHFNYSGGGNTRLKSMADYLQGGSIDGGGALQLELDPTEQPSSINLKE